MTGDELFEAPAADVETLRRMLDAYPGAEFRIERPPHGSYVVSLGVWRSQSSHANYPGYQQGLNGGCSHTDKVWDPIESESYAVLDVAIDRLRTKLTNAAKAKVDATLAHLRKLSGKNHPDNGEGP